MCGFSRNFKQFQNHTASLNEVLTLNILHIRMNKKGIYYCIKCYRDHELATGEYCVLLHVV